MLGVCVCRYTGVCVRTCIILNWMFVSVDTCWVFVSVDTQVFVSVDTCWVFVSVDTQVFLSVHVSF